MVAKPAGKKATLTDVAQASGVSLATVSRVLAHSNYPVSEAAKKRVLQAVAELDYVPNMAARALKKNTGSDIGIILPNISNPFYMQTLQGISTLAMESGHQLILCNSMRRAEDEHALLYSLYERRVLGIILSSVDEKADTVNSYAARGMPLVLLDQRLQGANCSMIHYDTRKGTMLAMRHLIERGHRRIALATLPITRWTRHETVAGYRDALVEAGIGAEDSLILVHDQEQEMDNGNTDLQAGAALAARFIREAAGATAVLCVNDILAFGVIQGLTAAGLCVPRDVSVVGFDDILLAAAYQPALTTVRYPSFEMGRFAVMMLLDALRSAEGREPLHLQLEPQLIARDTVASPKGI